MNIGFVGLGKLGLPVALSLENHGCNITACDISDKVLAIVRNKQLPYLEEGAQELLNKTKIKLGGIEDVVKASDIIFVPIQTPHAPKYEGITILPDERMDFDYSFLKAGVAQIAKTCQEQQKHVIIVVISTVLPGTISREILPLLNEYTRFCYNPFFLAMGKAIPDFENPEFVLLGCENKAVVIEIKKLYAMVHKKPVFVTDVCTAELIKVAYNTFIGSKISFINTMMEICEKTGADVDDVTACLSLATKRLISTKYLQAGMGDGGPCHPRDGIAMSWLAQELDLSFDLFEGFMLQREWHTKWLARIVIDEQKKTGFPVNLLGITYKPETNLTIGSSAILLRNLLLSAGVSVYTYDPMINIKYKLYLEAPAVFFIGTKHAEFSTYKFPKGSVIIDPWGYIPEAEGVKVISVGRRKSEN